MMTRPDHRVFGKDQQLFFQGFEKCIERCTCKISPPYSPHKQCVPSEEISIYRKQTGNKVDAESCYPD
jgi:hypothetical protein